MIVTELENREGFPISLSKKELDYYLDHLAYKYKTLIRHGRIFYAGVSMRLGSFFVTSNVEVLNKIDKKHMKDVKYIVEISLLEDYEWKYKCWEYDTNQFSH
tara:strand:+ start:322 stop:627 length:306 start_codon:yes stop_codon:yes gene_type:complete